ncbi:hypothetical protein JYU34_000979 [Plutella xylostella]|uniref:Uncharacterized protein n=1 Tax=Plutella xylostella TaxID=51655 RepID=A0ABQ7R5S7_PLUXY|nr:hypothetical protein JYU34_000979 [Plutella xylostella]
MKSKLLYDLVILFILNSVLCDDEAEEETVNDNLFKTKNLVDSKGSNTILTKLLSESRFNKDTVRSLGKDNDVVNHYEDITILGDDGELKKLKFKSVVAPTVPEKLQSNLNIVTHSELDSDKLTNTVSADKIKKGEEEKNKSEGGVYRSKFFDEMGKPIGITFYT